MRAACQQPTHEDEGPVTQYEAVYTHYPNRSLVDTISYGNGTSIKYEYDDADRVDG